MAIASSGAAEAGMMYQIRGDIVDGMAVTGDFSITVDENDLTRVLNNGDADLPDPIFISPWYGYDVLDAEVILGGMMFTEADLMPAFNEPAQGGPTAELWIQGLSIADLASQGGPLNNLGNISIIFEKTALDNISIGFQTTTGVTGTEENVINTQVIATLGGQLLLQGYTNVTVTQVTAVPEPLTLLGASTAIAIGAAFKRKQKN